MLLTSLAGLGPGPVRQLQRTFDFSLKCLPVGRALFALQLPDAFFFPFFVSSLSPFACIV
jgi:hypothetical protein